MRYRIEGHWRSTGESGYAFVDAPNPKAARAMGQSEGLDVETVTPIQAHGGEPKPPGAPDPAAARPKDPGGP